MSFVGHVNGVIMYNEVCYVIQHRDNSVDKDRTKNLIQVIKYVKSISEDIEIMVLEQTLQETSELKDLFQKINVKYIHLKNGGLFNRAWGFNCSISLTERSKFVFADNDMLLNKDDFNKGIELLESYDIVRPYNGFSNDLSPYQTIDYVFNKTIGIGTLRFINNFSGGIVMLTRQGFAKLGGFDERFEGWGGEDDEMHLHIEKLSKSGTVNVCSFGIPVTHLYHSRTVNDGNTQPNYNKNVSYITDGKRNEGITIGNVGRYDKN